MDRALGVLLDPGLAPIVDMVVRRTGDGGYEAASADGRVEFRRTGDGGGNGHGYERTGGEGQDPIADQSPDRLIGLTAEMADPHPTRGTNAYPFAYDHIAQLFDHPASPDLCVLHSGAHNWEDQGGHRGEHGSLGIVQARAPFVIAGRGVRADGVVPRVAVWSTSRPPSPSCSGTRPTRRVTTWRARTGSCVTTCSPPAPDGPATWWGSCSTA